MLLRLDSAGHSLRASLPDLLRERKLRDAKYVRVQARIRVRAESGEVRMRAGVQWQLHERRLRIA